MARASLPNSGQTCKGAAGIGAPTAPESRERVRGLARSRGGVTGGDGGDWRAAGKLSFLQCLQEAGAGGAAGAVARRVRKSEFCEKNQKRTKKIVDKNFPICIIFPSWIHFHSIIM
ncbi:hypothetical protein R6Z07M_008633 [Ovis aries]